MKKFNFKLETVLRVRRHREEKERQKLANLRRKKMRLEAQKSDINSDLQTFHTNRDEQIDGQSPIQHRQQYSYIHEQHQQMKQLDNKIDHLAKEVDDQRKKLIEANKQTKILKNLKSKHKMRFLEEVDRIEQKQLNEIATQRFNWQRR